MKSGALEFLQAEHAAWRPFEALLQLSDGDLSMALERANGWFGRDLMAHLAYWQGLALAVAHELALSETSETKIRSDVDWDTRGGDVVNEEVRLAGLALPMDEVRSRFHAIPGELRRTLASVPEARWLENAEYEGFLRNQTTAHYAAHLTDLAAVLAAATSAAD